MAQGDRRGICHPFRSRDEDGARRLRRLEDNIHRAPLVHGRLDSHVGHCRFTRATHERGARSSRGPGVTAQLLHEATGVSRKAITTRSANTRSQRFSQSRTRSVQVLAGFRTCERTGGEHLPAEPGCLIEQSVGGPRRLLRPRTRAATGVGQGIGRTGVHTVSADPGNTITRARRGSDSIGWRVR
jgi:hypothetical protein